MLVFILSMRKTEFWKNHQRSILLIVLTCLQSMAVVAVDMFVLRPSKQAIYKENFLSLISLFYSDLLLIPVLTYMALLFRRIEFDVLVKMGIFKDIEEMNDREMFVEYDKMRKQSLKVKQRYSHLKAIKDAEDRQKRYSINDEPMYK